MSTLFWGNGRNEKPPHMIIMSMKICIGTYCKGHFCIGSTGQELAVSEDFLQGSTVTETSVYEDAV